MPILFKGKTKQVTYDGGKFWIHTKLEGEPNFPPIRQEINLIPPPILENLEDTDGKKYSLAIVQEFGSPSLYRRHFDTAQNSYVYQRYSDLTQDRAWADPIDPGDNRLIDAAARYFWPDSERQALDITNATLAQIQSPLSGGQRGVIASTLLAGFGMLGSSLETVKQECQSRVEYDACLKHLIENTPLPANTTQKLLDALDQFKGSLTPANIPRLTLNIARDYDGHIATAGEVFTYARDFLIAELKKGQPDYVKPPLNLAADQNWNLLCSPGSDLPAEIDLATQTMAKQMLDSIMAVYKPNGTANFEIKNPVTREQLITANQSINQIRTEDAQGTPLGRCVSPFVSQIAKNATYADHEMPFLNTLQEKIRTTLPNVLIDAPLRNQFIPLRVDQWAGGPRGATHADFVEFQKQHPNAILLIPDNFTEAALADNRRHQRDPGNRGLAIPMKPHIVDNTDRANPVYDLCTLGIPTAHPSPGMGLEAQKAKVKEYFARLYGELRRGREIAVPQLDDSGNLRWAFGGGVVGVSTPLSQFVRDELTKLQNFCNGTAIDEAVDAAYKAAWDHALIAPLPLPKPELAPPPPAPESQVPGMQADKSLTSAGFRQKFREWLESKNCKNCQLIEDEDEKDKTRLLRGTLPSGVGVIIRKDQMRLDTKGGKPLTDDEFRESMSELIDMYKSAYHPGQIPPARPLGNDAQKAIIEELLVAKGVPMVAKSAETAAADSSVEETASPRRTF